MSKMKFDEFKDAVVGKIREYLPETFANADVRLQVVTKNNDLQLTGLTIKAVNSNIAPTIYLEQFFDAYEKGEDINVILQKIADMRISNEFQENFDVDEITDFNRCKGNIVPRLIGKNWNKELLQSRPHKEVADLAVTYCIMLGEDKNGTMSVPVSNELMSSWNISVNELHDIAIANMEKITPPLFSSISDVIGNILLDNAEISREEKEQALSEVSFKDDVMFVLTNTQKVHGAAQILNRNVMGRIISQIETKEFYILPSSIHEVLIIPSTPDMDVSMLESMVREVNQTQVSPEERLSDNVYVYTKNGIALAK